jgi:hypothetical protein
MTVFIMFFQPVSIWPAFNMYQPLRNSAILALIAYVIANKKSNVSFFSNKVNMFFILFAIGQVLSSMQLWISGGIETFNLWLRTGIVYYLITKSVTDEHRLKSLALMIVAGMTYLVYFSITGFVVHYKSGMRAGGFGWYENPNDLAIILVSTLPLFLLLANLAKSILVRYFFILLAGICSFNILFTGSRNGLLGLLTVGALSIFVSHKVSGFIRMVLLAVLLAGVFTVGITNVLGRNDLSGGLSGDDSSENRIEQWKAGMRMVVAKPLLGVGRDEFAPSAMDYGGIRGLQPHNTLVQVFAESGVITGFFFTCFSLYPLLYAWELVKKKCTKSGAYIYKFLAISLAGFWVCAFFSNRYQFYILYIVVALMSAARDNIIEKQGAIV